MFLFMACSWHSAIAAWDHGPDAQLHVAVLRARPTTQTLCINVTLLFIIGVTLLTEPCLVASEAPTVSEPTCCGTCGPAAAGSYASQQIERQSPANQL
jgi:hypothetical protein